MKHFICFVTLLAGRSEQYGVGVRATAPSCARIRRRNRKGTHHAQKAKLLWQGRKLVGLGVGVLNQSCSFSLQLGSWNKTNQGLIGNWNGPAGNSDLKVTSHWLPDLTLGPTCSKLFHLPSVYKMNPWAMYPNYIKHSTYHEPLSSHLCVRS